MYDDDDDDELNHVLLRLHTLYAAQHSVAYSTVFSACPSRCMYCANNSLPAAVLAIGQRAVRASESNLVLKWTPCMLASPFPCKNEIVSNAECCCRDIK